MLRTGSHVPITCLGLTQSRSGEARRRGQSNRTARSYNAAGAVLRKFYCNGFTVTELLVTISIASILMAIAIPIIQTPRTVSEANALLGALEFARSTAIKQGQNVVVCASTNSSTCNVGTSWGSGWIVLAAANRLCSASGGATGDQVLQIQQALTGTDSATWHTTNGTSTQFCFTGLGFGPVANNGLVEFQTTPVKTGLSRCVIVSGVGHVQIVNSGQKDVTNSVTCP